MQNVLRVASHLRHGDSIAILDWLVDAVHRYEVVDILSKGGKSVHCG